MSGLSVYISVYRHKCFVRVSVYTDTEQTQIQIFKLCLKKFAPSISFHSLYFHSFNFPFSYILSQTSPFILLFFLFLFSFLLLLLFPISLPLLIFRPFFSLVMTHLSLSYLSSSSSLRSFSSP